MHYSFTDVVPVEQKLYYRLKQTDKDGSYNYSKIVRVQTGGAGEQHAYNQIRFNNSFRIQLPNDSQNATLDHL